MRQLRFFPLILGFLSILVPSTSFGGAIVGTELNYRSLGSNRYEVFYSVFTDYPSSAPALQSTLTYSSAGCGATGTSILLLQDGKGEKIATACPNSGIAMTPSIKRWIFSGIVELPASCNDWKLGITDCCRNAYHTNIENPELTTVYTEVAVNNTKEQSSSPNFESLPDFYVYSGQVNRLNTRAACETADSVTVSPVVPMQTAVKPVIYLAAYSAIRPLRTDKSIKVEDVTGDYFFRPSQPETGVIAFTAVAWKGGEVAGSCTREYRITALESANHVPVLSGIDGTENRSISTCAGRPVSFYLFSSDDDRNDQLTVIMLDTLPGSELTNSAASKAVRYSWTPSVFDIKEKRHTVRFMVKDNSCPMPASAICSITIDVKGLGFTAVTSPASCRGVNDGSATVQLDETMGPFSVTWMQKNVNGKAINGLSEGTYTVEFSNQHGCSGRQEITVAGKAGIAPSAVTVTDATCSNSASGAVFLTLPKPDSSYEITWTPSGVSTMNATNLLAGVHSVMIRDRESGCTYEKSFDVGYSFQAPQVDLGPDQHACVGSVVQLGLNKEFSNSVWQDGSNSGIYLATASGNYSVLVTDEYGCTGSGNVKLEFASCENQENPLGDDAVTIFPNPTRNLLNINFKVPTEGETRLYVADLLGNVVLNKINETGTSTTGISVESLRPGVYLLYIEAGTEAAVYKFVKE